MHHVGASVCNECFLGLVFFFTATYLVPGSVNPACVKVDPENTVAIGQFSSTLSYCQLHDQQADDIYEIEEKTMKSNTASTPPADNVVARTCEGRIAPALEMFDPSSVKL